jgi:hypothetical protein
MSAREHATLPLPDYDHLPVSAVAQRIRSLPADDLIALLQYEGAHAARPAVLEIMRARLEELRAGAQPSGGTGQDGPDRPAPASATPAVRPETTAPPASPPPHGVPSQPARPKGNRQVP